MKRRIISYCAVVLLLALLCACSSNPAEPNNSELEKNETPHSSTETVTNELYEEAMTILDELNDPRIDDFRAAYDLLMDMPEDKDDFVNQLDEVNRIFEKYNIDFKYGGWYLQPHLSDESITQEGLDEYRTQNAYWDAEDLLEAIVYPVLFDAYGGDAQHIEGLVASDVIAAIESTCDYMLEDKVEKYHGCTETWGYIGTPKCDYEIKYQNNGLVESVNIPIVRSDAPMDDAAFTDFFTYDLDEQKQFAGDRFTSMIAQLNTIFTGYEVLCQIYTDEEISIICNYIKSLTIDDIWEQNMWAYGENEEGSEPLNYAGAVVSFDYKGNSVSIHYGLNSIYLRVIGGDYINQLSCRWYTLYCGLVLPDGNDETIATYQNYIDFNTAANDVTPDWSFDLDSNADKYINATVSDNDDTEKNDAAVTLDKIVLSMAESITVEGIIEPNTGTFPQYRLKLNNPIIVAFKEYGEDYEFTCEYLYFYDEAELNGGYDFASLTGRSCVVTAMLEDYRGGSELYFIDPVIESE